MRVSEEHKNLKIQVFLVVLTLFSTLLIQIADTYISEFEQSQTVKLFDFMLKMEKHTAHSIASHFAGFMQYLPFNLNTKEKNEELKRLFIEEYEQQVTKSPDFSKLTEDLRSGSISLNGYYNKSMHIHHDRSQDAVNEYNRLMDQYRKNEEKGTLWARVKSISFIVQALLICSIIVGYCRLIDSIGTRTSTKNSKQKSPAEPNSNTQLTIGTQKRKAQK